MDDLQRIAMDGEYDYHMDLCEKGLKAFVANNSDEELNLLTLRYCELLLEAQESGDDATMVVFQFAMYGLHKVREG